MQPNGYLMKNKLKLIIPLCFPLYVFATLGEDIPSIAKNAVDFKVTNNTSKIQVVQIDSYKIEQYSYNDINNNNTNESLNSDVNTHMISSNNNHTPNLVIPSNSNTYSNDNTYSIYQMTTLSGIEIKQYVAADKVFAVVWQGETAPNLTQLLGKYFHLYDSTTPKYKSSTLHCIEDQDLIVYYGNVNGYFYGRAIIPSLIPSGLAILKIK